MCLCRKMLQQASLITCLMDCEFDFYGTVSLREGVRGMDVHA